MLHSPVAAIAANRSNNWSGYNRGALQANVNVFHSISGNWTVPAARQHQKGQAEQSSTWIGIGGGCLDSACTAADPTLIQLGTEQDVGKTGKASYSAWWELVPAPSTTITSLKIHRGDRIHAVLSEAVTGSNVWTMTLRDVTTGKSWSQTVPYTSTLAAVCASAMHGAARTLATAAVRSFFCMLTPLWFKPGAMADWPPPTPQSRSRRQCAERNVA